MYVDVHSLYPSIITAFGICPAKDELQLVPRSVRALLSRRLQAKRMASTETNPTERRRQLAISDSFKNVVNSIYGYLGFGAGIWNDPEQAERITAIGRDILAQIIQYVVQTGGQPIEADTDGLYFVPPEQIKTPEQQEQYVRDLSATLPEGIEVGLQGTYEAMLSYADKNYALLGHSGNVIIHGSALRSQGLEPYLRRFLKEAIGHMLRGEFEKVIELHRDMNSRIVNREAPIEWLVRSDKLRESLEDYQRKVECGARGRSAAYELAQSCGGRFGSGDRIRYYFSGSGRVESPKLAEEFRADAPDYSIGRYMRRLDEMLEMLTPLFPPTLQNSMDGQLDLFG
jgi:DNA polymerase elongation subunit (family B)